MTGSVSSWLDELSQGDDEAAAPLRQRFRDRLIRRANRIRQEQPDVEVESEDIADSVFCNVIHKIRAGESAGIDDRKRLWRFLEKSLFHKLLDLKRKSRVRKNLQSRETADVLDSVPDDRFSPEQFAELNDQLEYVVRLLDEDTREVFKLVCEGHSTTEIAGAMNLSRRTVQRKIALIRDEWNAFEGAGE